MEQREKRRARSARRRAADAMAASVAALVAALLATLLTASSAAAQVPVFPPARTGAPLGAPTPAATYRPITWAQLAPAGWDGMKDFQAANMGALEDGDPRASALLKKMREAWDKAPVNMGMVGQSVRIAGYVVPLEGTPEGLKEFLLVPYYGACIHTPPPPSNQVVHVLPRTDAKGFKSMDTVWVSGVLAYSRNDSYMGVSSWRIEAVSVQRHSESGAATPLR